MSKNHTAASVVPRAMLVPFILITLLFPLWGFANDITNPMVAAFKNILLLTNFESSLVQAAFYGGYALMSIPAAIFIKKFSYKSGILIGLGLYALGCLLFIPSGWSLTFAPFLLAYLIMTCGLSFLETTANPYILSMGDESTATRRLNLAQAFNPMGSILGMFVASMVILVNLNGTSENARRAMKASSDGVTVHAQVVSQQLDTVKGLESTVAEKTFDSSKRLLKRAMLDSSALAQNIALLSDPQAELAAEISKNIAAQPAVNKFAAAFRDVAIVLQLRDRVPPTEAEMQRDKVFHGPGGLELAIMLGKEQSILADSPLLAAARPSLASASTAAAGLATTLEKFYMEKADASRMPEIIQGFAAIRASLESVQSELKAIPTASIASHAADTGAAFKEIQKSDLSIIVGPYAIMGCILIVILGIFAWKLPHDIAHEGDNQLHLKATFMRLVKNGHYLWGVVAQAFYVGAQIMCWTFIIQYAELELGISKATAQNLNILAMIIFVSSRFVCTFLLHYVKPGVLLGVLAIGGMLLTAGAIFIHGYGGLYSLIAVSACMSLMFPTIYGIALDGLGDDAKLGSAGLILAIGGGCVMPALQGAIIDLPPINLGFMELASVRASFFLPLFCFVVIAIYGFWSCRERIRHA